MIATLTMNPSVDKSATVERVVADHKLRCDPPRHDPGGGGINVSRAIRRLGGSSLALYPAGGPLGEYLETLVEAEGVQQQVIRIEKMTRENLTVTEESDGQQYRFGMPGPELSEKEWMACLDALAAIQPPPGYVVASGSLPPGAPDDCYAQVARLAREAGSRTVVDSSSDPLRLAVEEGVYLLKPNIRELGQIAGESIRDEEQIRSVALELVASGAAEVVVVTLGAGGVFLASENHADHIRAPTVPVKSRIGAGDSTVGAIVLALSQGRTIADAVCYGVAAGSAAVMTPGTDLCRREDTERLYETVCSHAFGE